MPGIPICLKSSIADGHDFATVFAPPIQLTKNKSYEIALRDASIVYSWHNFSAAKGNNKFKYSADAGVTWNTVTIPDGNYALGNIETYLQQVMRAANHYDAGTTGLESDDIYYIEITGNISTGKVEIHLSNDYQIDLTTSTIYAMLGFASDTILATNGTHSGVTTPDIGNGVTEVAIHCSIARGAYVNSFGSDIIYTLRPNCSAYNFLNFSISTPMFVNIQNISQISEIRMRFTDINNNPLILNGEPVSYLLYIRECE